MARFIRWQGIAGFIVIIGLIATFVYVFADDLAKSSIEYSGEKAIGAEVNVADVEISYSPLTLTIRGMQATDPDKPNENIFSFDSAIAGIDLWQYLFGKIIIDELSVEGLAFSSNRVQPGQVFKDKKSQKAITEKTDEQFFSTPDVSLPDPKELLADANLKTVKQGQLLKTTYQEERAKLTALKKQLPNKNVLNSYEKQVKALADTKIKSLEDIEKIKRDYDAIKAKFLADKAVVVKAKQQLQQSKDKLATQAKVLKRSPKEDWQAIEKEYQLDKVDGADFAHILFGQQAREYYAYGETAYEKIKPLLASSEETEAQLNEAQVATGRFVHFKEDDPLPEVLIKKALMSGISNKGNYRIELTEVTHQHWIRNLPTTYQVTSTNFMNQGQASLNGIVRLSEQKFLALNGQWQFDNVKLSQVDLQKSEKFSLAIESALMAGKGQFNLLKSELNSNNDINITHTNFSGGAANQYTQMLVDTFKALDSLALNIKLSGEASSPHWQINSPINQQLKGAMQKQLTKKLDQFKGSVQKGLNAKLAEQLKLTDTAASEIVELDGLLNDTENSLNKLLTSDVVEQKKQELKDKAEDKIKNKLNKKLNKLFG